MELIDALNDIKEIDKTDNYLDEFNIFSVLNIKYDELKICKVINELIDPIGSHKYGSKFLKLFFSDVLHYTELFTKSNDWLVYNEYVIDASRRIDILIESDKKDIKIPIEVKIFADDQRNQIDDYEAYAKKFTSYSKIYYLTLDGKKPSEESCSVTTDDDLELISFKNDIYFWLLDCLALIKSDGPLRETVVMFINNIKELTGRMEKEKAFKYLNTITDDEQLESLYELKSAADVYGVEEVKKIFDCVRKICIEKLKSNFPKDAFNESHWLDWEKKQMNKFFDEGYYGIDFVFFLHYKVFDGTDIHLIPRLCVDGKKGYIFVELTTESQDWTWIDEGESFKSLLKNKGNDFILNSNINFEESFEEHVIIKSNGIMDKNGGIPSFVKLNFASLQLNDENVFTDFCVRCADYLINLINATSKLYSALPNK